MLFNADKVATMMQAIGTPHFGAAVLEMLDPRLEIAHCTAFEQAGDAAPRCLMAAGRGETADQCARSLADEYTHSGFAGDPVLAMLRRRGHPTPRVDYLEAAALVEHNRELAAFVERYYRNAGVAQEATYSVRADDRLLWVTLYRRAGQRAFDQRERVALHDLSRLLLCSAQRQGQLLPAATATGDEQKSVEPGEDWGHSRAERLARIRSALLLSPCGLTPREADICAHIVVGYPALAISLNLGISVNTVATHRKRAYAKLGLSSQTELFNACLRWGPTH